ncbi:hypothetical protein ACH4T9_12755 [Micromonospora sp. NPDC020750]|uniref:hypothetical protein n=1 Tax=unclassified Micromonospora TaxID=2617518 RepID=UPI0037A819EE
MSETMEPPETHPAYRVEVDPGAGPMVEFQAVPFGDQDCDTPHVNMTFRMTEKDRELVFSCRSLLSDAEMGAMSTP